MAVGAAVIHAVVASAPWLRAVPLLPSALAEVMPGAVAAASLTPVSLTRPLVPAVWQAAGQAVAAHAAHCPALLRLRLLLLLMLLLMMMMAAVAAHMTIATAAPATAKPSL